VPLEMLARPVAVEMLARPVAVVWLWKFARRIVSLKTQSHGKNCRVFVTNRHGHGQPVFDHERIATKFAYVISL
jgi:hypothetical protein